MSVTPQASTAETILSTAHQTLQAASFTATKNEASINRYVLFLATKATKLHSGVLTLVASNHASEADLFLRAEFEILLQLAFLAPTTLRLRGEDTTRAFRYDRLAWHHRRENLDYINELPSRAERDAEYAARLRAAESAYTNPWPTARYYHGFRGLAQLAEALSLGEIYLTLYRALSWSTHGFDLENHVAQNDTLIRLQFKSTPDQIGQALLVSSTLLVLAFINASDMMGWPKQQWLDLQARLTS